MTGDHQDHAKILKDIRQDVIDFSRSGYLSSVLVKSFLIKHGMDPYPVFYSIKFAITCTCNIEDVNLDREAACRMVEQGVYPCFDGIDLLVSSPSFMVKIISVHSIDG
jgi:hypothetical protein